MKNAQTINRSTTHWRHDPNQILADHLGAEFTAYRRAWRKAELGERPDFPLHLDVDITTVCNFRCPMCPAGQPQSAFPGLGLKLSEETYLKALREGENRLPSIRIGVTGEPLLNPNVARWIQEAKRFGVLDVALITNGLLLSGAMSEALIKSGLTRLMISVDAASQATYRKTRPGGDWGKLLANIGEFLAIRQSLDTPLPLLRLSFVEMALNIHDREKFRLNFGSLADYLTFQNYQNILGQERSNWGLTTPKSGHCAEPLTRLALHANGGLFPCCSDFGRLAPLGHFPENSLSEIWNSPLALALARDQSWSANCQSCQKAADPDAYKEQARQDLTPTDLRPKDPLKLAEPLVPQGLIVPTTTQIPGSAPSASIPEGR
ncbi:MAG: radical SAM protein [Deltaproteobacteria bacterium]|jgi:radical SAM protein with 4Fe4S-binding SPASM domain|nr:radical SAM protein [Deltaproteobacteria bacterium]